jgi:hypothetical protein
MIQHEITERDSKRMALRLRWAKLPQSAALEDLDTRTQRGIDPKLIALLAALGWIREKLNVLITGPCGVGKSFIASALANKPSVPGLGYPVYSRNRRESLSDCLEIARDRRAFESCLQTLDLFSVHIKHRISVSSSTHSRPCVLPSQNRTWSVTPSGSQWEPFAEITKHARCVVGETNCGSSRDIAAN